MRSTASQSPPGPGIAPGKSAVVRPSTEPERRSKPTYYLLDESALDAAEASSSVISPRVQTGESLKDSSFGVQSLADTMRSEPALDMSSTSQTRVNHGEKDSTIRPDAHEEKPSPRKSTVDDERSALSSTSSTGGNRPPSTTTNNARQSLTAHLTPSPINSSSALSSPKSSSLHSFQVSDSDSIPGDGSSQAIMSSEEDEDEPPSEVQDSSPQLVMPSIKMPSRRPFTERGKTMGRFKVLLAGAAGTLRHPT